jgi:hypothetical protein
MVQTLGTRAKGAVVRKMNIDGTKYGIVESLLKN